MKKQYELRCRHALPRRTYVLIRVDGRSFHQWTKGLAKPYDRNLMDCMDAAARELFKQVSGAKLGYVQSDEISLLLTDFDTINTEAWFDNCQNKLESIAASIATMAFNQAVAAFNGQAAQKLAGLGAFYTVLGEKKIPNATFDARAWTIPDYVEVENYFIDRQKDAIRNSVTMLAHHYTSHKSLMGKPVAHRLAVIRENGDSWTKHPARFRYGAAIFKDHDRVIVDSSTPEFTNDRDYLKLHIPRHWEETE